MSVTLLMTACCTTKSEPKDSSVPSKNAGISNGGVEIALSDHGISVDGVSISSDPAAAVYAANDIVYYESGKDFTYGEGTATDAHSVDDGAAHTVVHITTPGTYSVSGTLSQGQIAVDLGGDAEENPDAVVTLILNGVDITCEVAPAVIFYNVYECGSSDEEAAAKDVDTSAAGANVIIADGTTNTVNGSYVARIYKPDSVILNEDGTEVKEAKKLHKYDAAFYSKMSMNVGGEKEGTGILNINAENEGLDSELHLTINGGNINIRSGNDGINTNEDGVSVTTVNGGSLIIKVTGETGEGDGIDSNGWLVINGGTVVAAACANSADAGIDSDMGVHINGGTVIASGHMLDHIEDGGQTYATFSFAQKQAGSEKLSLKNESGEVVMELCPENDYSILVYSSPNLMPETYTLWSNEQQMVGQSGGMVGGPGMPNSGPVGMMPPELPENMVPPKGEPTFEGVEPPRGEFSPGQQPPAEGDRPERPDMPGKAPWKPGFNGEAQELAADFHISDGANMFLGVSPVK